MSDADLPTPVTQAYWTPKRLAIGALMAIGLFGAVAVVQWEHITQIGASADRARAFVPAEVPPTLFDLTDLKVPQDQILRGGPPKDGIPALTDPKTVAVQDADFMRPDDRVIGITINNQSRGYPIKVLNLHECYNDTLGGVPIAVVFCPLCDSVTVVDRRLGEKTFEFGISGLLHNSNVLLYDRQDDALWSQAGLIAISGPHAGESLTHLHGWEITAFELWAQAHPESTIASLDTGHYPAERYDSPAYASYFLTDEVMFPVSRSDPRFANKAPVIGVMLGEKTKAYPVETIAAAPDGRVTDTIDGRPVVLEADDAGTVRIVQAPEDSRVIHTFWFAWFAFHPDTGVYSADRALRSED